MKAKSSEVGRGQKATSLLHVTSGKSSPRFLKLPKSGHGNSADPNRAIKQLTRLIEQTVCEGLSSRV